ncbi:N-formylglutamate amidohydrolase [Ahniella affigens]|uniref:N-formylglutamate amidohydrolase n=1 Tax=Ahniella affigens TaxID=2021234 RepID=A0A2P1PRM7_9GAMM|nr:N-formylglutamate amidohydrolase [Ahniella affigens]AVP97507.1 N-formylglutamate amidohydrolase [Ahniella affigens]
MLGDARANAAAAVAILNRDGKGPVVLICEHASNFIPLNYERLGVSMADLQRHIAWDIGALGLSEQLSALLDAPLVFATHSRLLLDLNRDPSAPDSIVTESENIAVPGNRDLPDAERQHRADWLYRPFHAEIDALIDERLGQGLPTAVISIHSFTPVYLGVPRPWQIGVISREDRRLSDRILHALARDESLSVGDNQPYTPAQRVYHSIERHAEQRGLPGAMIEVRNDQIESRIGQMQWAGRLAHDFRVALDGFFSNAALPARRLSIDTVNH